MELIDTNILIRALTQDHPDHSVRSSAYLQAVADGSVSATITEGVIVEVVQVLESKALFGLSRQDTANLLRPLLELRSLRVPHRTAFLRALAIYETTSLDFVDTLNIAHAERLNIRTVVSFDRHYDRVPTISRREP